MTYKKLVILCVLVSCVCYGREYRVDSQEEFNKISAVQMRYAKNVEFKNVELTLRGADACQKIVLDDVEGFVER